MRASDLTDHDQEWTISSAPPDTQPSLRAAETGDGSQVDATRPWDTDQGLWSRLGLVRSSQDRLLAGVAGGVGERLGVDSVVVRAGFVALSAAGGAGIVLYLLLWAVADEAGPLAERPQPARSARRAFALGLQIAGVLLLLRGGGLWLGDAVVVPVSLVALGSGVLWTRSDAAGRARLATFAARVPGDPVEALFAGRVSPWRSVGGALLVLAGMGLLLAANLALEVAGSVLVAMLVTVLGLAVALGPGLARLGRQLGDERRHRIRSQERAEMAAHLHDSVLHTLALIQRTDDPQEMVGLARGQERELRSWLNGRTQTDGERLSVAVDAVASRVERQHHVGVEAVVVGDALLDESLRALLQAIAEAAVNAARHSGAPSLSVYVEVEGDHVTAYVRDEGVGFNPLAVPEDRRGIAESIRGRMERNGGSAEIVSEPGEGTEVILRMTRRTS